MIEVLSRAIQAAPAPSFYRQTSRPCVLHQCMRPWQKGTTGLQVSMQVGNAGCVLHRSQGSGGKGLAVSRLLCSHSSGSHQEVYGNDGFHLPHQHRLKDRAASV